MIHRKQDRVLEIKTNLKGGTGDLSFLHLFSKDELAGKADLLAAVTLQPGQSIGEHSHTENGEVYFVLSGTATVTEDGEVCTLTPGDCEYCADGHTHSIRNDSDAPVVFLAFIAGNR